MAIRTGYLLDKLFEHELDVCRWCNRACGHEWIKQAFTFISWLGNGKFWYALMLALPLYYGPADIAVSLQLAAVGAAGLLIYKLIKSGTERMRPYMRSASIKLGTAPLDKYSFPSGHTLHAASFTLIAGTHHPELLWMLIPVALLIAASRIVLGLHYPTDVLTGGAIGSVLAICSFNL
jgi:undecaprenyl-diphosphatase